MRFRLRITQLNLTPADLYGPPPGACSRPTKRLFRWRWRYVVMILLHTLISLLLLTNISLSRLPAAPPDHKHQAGPSPLAIEEKTLARIYEQVGPAVVKVIVTRPGHVDRHHRQKESQAAGSGLIVDLQGHIVTNHHVIAKASKVVVQLASGRVVRAQVVARDAASDLAVLRIEVPPTELTVARFANSDTLQVGQIALVIGHPFGLDTSLTVGHISGLGREIPSGDKYRPKIKGVIQTDAALNPGDSGSPLVNRHGEVIGLNASILSTSGGSQGVGFALPSNLVQQKLAELLPKGPAPHSAV